MSAYKVINCLISQPKHKEPSQFHINAPLYIDYHGLTAIFQIMFMGDGGIE